MTLWQDAGSIGVKGGRKIGVTNTIAGRQYFKSF